ncbi:Xenotropic and polytropic retrovirus receptor 1, partial [Entomortierella lignicola]
MKFAKYLQEEVVPEWRKAYLDYKQCKKYLKAIEAALDKLEQDPAQQTQNRSNHGDIRPSASLPSDLEQSNRILNGPITLEPESEVYEPPAPAHVDSSSSPDESTGTTPIISQSHGILRNYDTIPVSSQSAPLTPLATPTLGKNQPDNDLPIGSGVNKKSRRSISLKNGLPGG